MKRTLARTKALASTLLAQLTPTIRGRPMCERRSLASLLLATSLSCTAANAPLPQYAPQVAQGVASCANGMCHGSVREWPNSPVLQNEYVTWTRADKHARAYAVLTSLRSQRIAERLALARPAYESDECLDCHTHNVPEPLRGPRFALQDGVGCEACHGNAERWLASHKAPASARADEHARGMFPLEIGVERARLCLSCHFGSARKFVSHALMAAGHPRLSFELDTFSRMQPAHSRSAERGSDAVAQGRGVRAWAIGQAIAAYDLLDILQDPVRGRAGMFPELVLFDCDACHHPRSSPRGAGRRLGVGPGVVRLNDAGLLMLRQIVRGAAPDALATFTQQVHELHRAIARGDAALARARALRTTIERLIPRIAAHDFAAADLRRMLLGLVGDGLEGKFDDYAGAEQAAMAIQSIIDVMNRQGLLDARRMRPALARTLAALADEERYRPQNFQLALRALRADLTRVVGP